MRNKPTSLLDVLVEFILNPVAFVRIARDVHRAERRRMAEAGRRSSAVTTRPGVITANPDLGPDFARRYAGPTPRDTTPDLPTTRDTAREWSRPAVGINAGPLTNRRAVVVIHPSHVDPIVNTLNARVLDVIETLLPTDTYVTRARYSRDLDVFEALVMAAYLPETDPAAQLPHYSLSELETMEQRAR